MSSWNMQDRDRMWILRGMDEHEGSDPTTSPTTPLHFGTSTKRQTMCHRNQLMNGRIQKPNVTRSRSAKIVADKYAKAPQHRSYDVDSLHAQLLNYMNTTGVDQHKVVQVLERVKDLYTMRRREQQQLRHDTEIESYFGRTSPSRTPVLPSPQDDPPVKASTIALLQQKFTQLERYKESIRAHHENPSLYPCQPSTHTPLNLPQHSSVPSSAHASQSGFHYPVQDTSAVAASAHQHALLVYPPSLSSSSCARPSSATMVQGDTRENWKPQSWQSSASKEPWSSPSVSGSSSGSSNCRITRRAHAYGHESSCSNDEAEASSLLQYILQASTDNYAHQLNLTAFQKMDLAGTISGSGSARMCNLSTDSTTDRSPSAAPELAKGTSAIVEMANSDNISPLSASDYKNHATHPGAWGDADGLVLPRSSSGALQESYRDASEYSGESSDDNGTSIDQQQELDTSLHL